MMALVLPRCLAICVAVSALSAVATAQQPPALKPYKPVEVTLPAPHGDKSLDVFRKQLAAIAQRKDRAAFNRLVVPKEFFWESDLGGMFDAKKSGADNLATALRLAERPERAWAVLAGFVAESSIGRGSEHAQRCAPALPGFDDAELAALTEATNTDVMDWSYPRAAGLELRDKPAANAGVAETIGLVLVRVLGTEKDRWTRVATPGGKLAYAPPGALVSPLADRLCFGKDAGGNWRIVGYVGAGD